MAFTTSSQETEWALFSYSYSARAHTGTSQLQTSKLVDVLYTAMPEFMVSGLHYFVQFTSTHTHTFTIWF